MCPGATDQAMTRWLITGANGQLGRDLVSALAGQDVTAWTRADVDLTDGEAVRRAAAAWADIAHGPAYVINAAAYTAVDPAETDEATAHAVNAAAPGVLAGAVAGRARTVHVSTDYVFAGDADRPYEPTDPTGPRTAYGRTKLAGERAVLAADPGSLVVRTSWVFSTHGGNFVDTMLRLEGTRDTVDVVTDQRGSPTWSRDLATALVAAAQVPAVHGLVHCTNTGETTWFGLARKVFSAAGADPGRVRPATSAAVPRPAPRPTYSVLGGASWAATGLPVLPPWADAVAAAVRIIRA